MLKVCISGGPCSGKSSIQATLTKVFAQRGYKILFCPETATELILNGIIPGKEISIDKFQEFVLDKQLAKETLYDEIAKSYDSDKLIIIYDRGLCDQMAYISKEKFEYLLHSRKMTLADAYSHYDCVLHLVTAAEGCPEHYQWNDPSKDDCGNNAARSESPEEAIEKDHLTKNAWIGHNHLRVFDNSTNFEGKTKRVVEEICNLLGEPIPNEIERKFLIKKPTKSDIESLGFISKTNIIQTYLKQYDSNVERRIRQRGTEQDGFLFYYTEKTDKGNGIREEYEKLITPMEYIYYMTEADNNLHQVHKTRYCYIYNNQYIEMDLYPFSDEYAIIEVELHSMSDTVYIPDTINVVREVTHDIRYRNKMLAKTQKL